MSTFEERYLSGRELWGDSFSDEEIAAWFADEKDAYAQLGAETGSAGAYGYHAFNEWHGFRHLPAGRYDRVLGLGSAFGAEFLPVLDRLGSLTVLEPAATLRSADLKGVPIQYVDPQPSGLMPFGTGSFDLVTSFGTLHHIPNVSTVVAEMARVTRPGGWVLIREPVISMGDWRSPRGSGVTVRERGIPLELFPAMFERVGLRVERGTLSMFPTTRRLGRYHLGFDTRAGVVLDAVLSRLTARSMRYHAQTRWQKVRPTAVFYVLEKVS
jgi:SAM-dependent methyltransferase